MSDAVDSEVPLGTFEEERARPGYQPVKFQADAALIRELGERLVGAPHIALAELVKNAYDADATRCEIRLDRTRITVSDNGHGMNEADFRDHWMTIGSTHKRERRTSRDLKRAITGSKGVGRLSAQFLAHKLQMITKSADEATSLHALVDWDEAVTAEKLTEAEAMYRREDPARTAFPAGSPTGTRVILERLNQSWEKEQVKELGRQLWMLNSPLPRFGNVTTGGRVAQDFEIVFDTSIPGFDDQFASQMRAAIDNYSAAIEGELRRENGRAVSHVKVSFRDGDTYSEEFAHPDLIDHARWQVRVYNLVGRQPSGISVQDAREYFERFGVMVFDAGFRLPFYGKESDWLGIDYDHAHRRTLSKLLPSRLQVDRGLNDLPTQGRLLGVVAIDTGKEATEAAPEQIERRDFLQILVTRDRLVDNGAYRTLRDAVRQSLDLYATRNRARAARLERDIQPYEAPTVKIRRIESLIREAVAKFPYDDTISTIQDEFESLDLVVEQQQRADDKARALLGPLAAAGMAALALEHENRREIENARGRVRSLKILAEAHGDPKLTQAIVDLENWLARFEAGRRVFAPLLEEDERDRAEAFRVHGVVREVVANIGVLLPRVSIETDIPNDVRLPQGTFAEWHAILQNVMTNAANAMLDCVEPKILVEAARDGRRSWLRVSDVGVGIELDRHTDYFEPFARNQRVSAERVALGLGGMGLGLTIVRMIADQRGCTVRFVPPPPGWNTTFELAWTERTDEDSDM